MAFLFLNLCIFLIELQKNTWLTRHDDEFWLFVVSESPTFFFVGFRRKSNQFKNLEAFAFAKQSQLI